MPANRTLVLRTGSRLHFGLWAWGAGHAREFGGIGMMVERPQVVLRCTSAARFEARGEAAARIQRVADACATRWAWPALPACRIETTALAELHAGFGVGTQLSLAVARALAVWTGDDLQNAEQLAAAAGRGRRSAIGSYGFERGGLLVDEGKRPGDAIGTLALRRAVPEVWRVLLVTPAGDRGKAGGDELQAFAQLPPVPEAVTRRLQRLAYDEIVPAAEAADFTRFATAIAEYGSTAGKCFAPVQGGVYATARIAELVACLERCGAAGVGQSSWGPTVFAFAADEPAARSLRERLEAELDSENYRIEITRPRNRGAEVIEST